MLIINADSQLRFHAFISVIIPLKVIIIRLNIVSLIIFFRFFIFPIFFYLFHICFFRYHNRGTAINSNKYIAGIYLKFQNDEYLLMFVFSLILKDKEIPVYTCERFVLRMNIYWP